MPQGNINTIDRINRLSSIKELLDEGKDAKKIAEELGMTVRAVNRNIKHLEEINISDITPELKAQKRIELENELIVASEEAITMFQKYKDDDQPRSARSFFKSWLETIEMRIKLFGLDVKADNVNLTQFNNYQMESDKIDVQSGEKLAKMLKSRHEEKVSEKVQDLG